MKERPILFSDAMVRAILDGRKTQTRRVVKPQPIGRIDPVFSYTPNGLEIAFGPENLRANGCPRWWRCPYGKPGDRLWVREAWRQDHGESNFDYLADGKPGSILDEEFDRWKWRPSIHMPRSASRILLEITGVRVERVQDISRVDARAEGCTAQTGRRSKTPEGAFRELWDSINADRNYGCDVNPWVWVVEFKRVQP